MKYVFTTLIFVCSLITSYSQNNLPDLTAAKDEFIHLYYAVPVGINENWYARLTKVNEFFFNINSKYLPEYFNVALKGKTDADANAIINRIADSLNTFFFKEHAFDSSKQNLERLKDVLPRMSDIFNTCLAGKLIYQDSIPPHSNLNYNDCFNKCYSDTKISSNVQLALAGYNVSQKHSAAQTIALYVMANCKAVYNFSKRTLMQEAAEQYISSRHYYFDQMPKLIASLYSRKSIDSLTTIFPSFLQYEQQLKLFTLLNSDVADQKIKITKDSIIVTAIYASNLFTNAHVEGVLQLCYSADGVPELSKFIYTQRAKLLNVASIEKRLHEKFNGIPPPPPQQ